MEIVNWELVKHPINWITVLLMIFIAGIALHMILQYMQPSKVTKQTQASSLAAS